MAKKLKAISLFAGVGGICLAFKQNNVDIVFANDIDKYACETYRQNFDNLIIEDSIENINKESIPDADIVLFGFPCQAFSIAGLQKGFDDSRGNMFFEALNVIKIKKPQSFLLENVKNLISHDSGKTFNIILNSLKNEGYYIRYQVINSMEYGNVPQNRERIYMVGFKNKDMCDSFYFPEPQLLTKSISDIVKQKEKKDEKYYYTKSKYYEMLSSVVVNKGRVYQLRRIYVRENKSNVCPTLTANMGTGGHNVPLILDDYGIRKLTPKECFLLQGFPQNYILPNNIADSHLYKQAGNTVTVSVVNKIANNMVNILL